MESNRFELRAPSNQTIVDIFKGHWATNLDHACGVTGTGTANLFNDVRIGMATSLLGRNGRFDGYKILELGPLEGAHSVQLEQAGASELDGVEANTSAFLKCLLVKQMLGLKAQYHLGDVISYLKQCHKNFDLIYCVGILYHMSDPIELIKQICLHTNRCFVWTHYFDLDAPNREGVRVPRAVEKNGFCTIYYERDYPAMDGKLFLGGNKPRQAWLTKDEIVRAFAHFGLSDAMPVNDVKDYPLGAHFNCAFSRPAPNQ